MRLIKKLTSYITATTISLIIVFNAQAVNAQILNDNSLAIGFAPTSTILKLQPGNTYKGEFTAWNLAPQARTYDLVVRGFKQIENFPGTARILTEQEEARDPFSASKWIKISQKSVNLKSNEYTKIQYEIQIPQDSASGEFHAMIFLVSKSPIVNLGPNSTSSSNLGSGPVFLINVGNQIIEKADIEYFRTNKSFYELPPVTFLTRYVNKGNTHVTPAGDIILENFLGQEIDKVTFNENRQSLIRGNAGNYADTWESKNIFFKNGKIAIGPIKARLITTYMSQNPGYAALSASTTFWVLPWKHILAIIIIAGIIYRLIFTLIKRNAKKTSTHNTSYDYPKFD